MNKLANVILSLGLVFLLAILVYGIQGWIDGALLTEEIFLYLAVPAAGVVLLLICFKLDREKKASVALCFVAVGGAVYAAEAYLVLSERRNEVELDFVNELRRQGDNAYPFIHPEALLEPGPDGGLRSVLNIDGLEFLPLAQISKSLSVACNELGENMVYQMDRHGFRNSEETWTAEEIDIAAIGDSFVEGDCVGPEDNMIAWVKRSYPKTLNLGVGGTGPLEQLGILKEYARPFRPKIVTWVFYEGNDWSNLESAKESPLLLRYLEPGFTQGLLQRQREIDQKLADYVLDRMAKAVPEPRSGQLDSFLKLRTLRTRLLWARHKERKERHYDVALFEAILTAAKDSVESWGGRLHFVYLPSAARYFGDDLDREELLTMQRRVRDLITRLDIAFIDVAAVFEAKKQPERFWFHPNSHYNEEGYQLAAQTILNALSAPLDQSGYPSLGGS